MAKDIAGSGRYDALPFWNPELPLEERVKDLVGRMTLEEKVSQMTNSSAAIPRLGVPEYNWWNEALHGVARAGVATVFPQAIGMAASFDAELLHEVAVVISEEARAKHHEEARQGDRRIYKGLTFWSPNVNIFRDPRWGRGQETYGEDPYLTGRMGVAFVRGLQGDDPKYLKLVATPKHYAVHSGPEALRHHFDARADAKDLRETYLPAFRDCIVEAKAYSIMGAYNRTNGEACCASQTLLQKILRDEWGFEGFVVSDCGAIYDIHAHHTVTSTPAQSAALAVSNGCDLECGVVYPSLVEAVQKGLIPERQVDVSVSRLMRARFKLGMFDPPERVAYARIPYEANDTPAHAEVSLRMARESIVLLKNAGSLLPLRKNLRCVAVIGPNADTREVLLGNYNGTPSRPVTVLEGIKRAVSPTTKVMYAEGSDLYIDTPDHWGKQPDIGFAEALAAAERAEVVIMCLGLTANLEGEEGSAKRSQWEGDRVRIELPAIQQRLLEAVAAKKKPMVLVLMSGSPIAIPWAHERVDAILEAWYPGQAGGTAVAEALFGDFNPAGRLPITFVESLDQLPPFSEYSMKGRTYRYIEKTPLYPFGYGLSYTSFSYANLTLGKKTVAVGEVLKASVEVSNTGSARGDEVVQLYLSDLEASVRVPRWQLQGFTRITLDPKERKTVSFLVAPRQMALIDEKGKRVLEPGKFRLYVGGRQPDKRSGELAGTAVLSADFEVTGKATELPY